MAEKSNPLPNKNDPLNHPDLSAETFTAQLQMSLSELTITPSSRPHFTDENLGEVGLSLDPESDISGFIDNKANIEGTEMVDQANDDIFGEGMGWEVGLGLGFSDDDDYDDSWLIDEYDDMSLNVAGGYMMGGLGRNVAVHEVVNMGSEALEFGVGNVIGGNGAGTSWDSPWFGEDDSGARSDVELLIYDGVEVIDDDGYFDHGAYFIEEYNMMLEQFLLESVPNGNRPASIAAIENLESVIFTRENAENEGLTCAVCKEQFNAGEMAKKLPCSHHYHEDCILPWLGTHNTCPVCRDELPTDDDPKCHCN